MDQLWTRCGQNIDSQSASERFKTTYANPLEARLFQVSENKHLEVMSRLLCAC